jgi:hypothetical protein
MRGFFVGLLGLEPRLFWTKTRRVASYTIDQSALIAGANLVHILFYANIFKKNYKKNLTSLSFLTKNKPRKTNILLLIKDL